MYYRVGTGVSTAIVWNKLGLPVKLGRSRIEALLQIEDDLQVARDKVPSARAERIREFIKQYKQSSLNDIMKYGGKCFGERLKGFRMSPAPRATTPHFWMVDVALLLPCKIGYPIAWLYFYLKYLCREKIWLTIGEHESVICKADCQ